MVLLEYMCLIYLKLFVSLKGNCGKEYFFLEGLFSLLWVHMYARKKMSIWGQAFLALQKNTPPVVGGAYAERMRG